MGQRSWSSVLLVAALALLAAAVVSAHAVALTSPAAGFFHDDGVYLVTARALAEGRGYRIISLPVEIAQTKYPILFPLLLSFAWRVHPVFPDNMPLLRMVPLLAGAAWLVLVYLFVRREGEGRLTAAAIVGLTGATPLVVFSATSLLSETLFAALAWGALWRLRGAERGDAGRRAGAWAGLLAAGAIHARTVGLALLPAGLWALWRRGHRSSAAAFGLVTVLLVAPWFLWIAFQEPPAFPYLDFYTSQNYASWNVLFQFGLAEKLRILAWNLLYLVASPAQLLVAPRAALPLLLGIGALAFWGLGRDAMKRANAVHAFLFVYVAILLLWAWPPLRFVVPIYPFLLLFLLRGLRRVLRAVPDRGAVRRHTLAVLLAALMLHGGWKLLDWGRNTARTGIACPATGCTRGDWSEVERALIWIRDQAPDDAVLMGNLDPTLYLYTGRTAVRAFTTDPSALFYSGAEGRRPIGSDAVLRRKARESGASYFVSIPLTSFAEEPYLQEILADLTGDPEAPFVVVEEASGSWVTVYRIDRSKL